MSPEDPALTVLRRRYGGPGDGISGPTGRRSSETDPWPQGVCDPGTSEGRLTRVQLLPGAEVSLLAPPEPTHFRGRGRRQVASHRTVHRGVTKSHLPSRVIPTPCGSPGKKGTSGVRSPSKSGSSPRHHWGFWVGWGAAPAWRRTSHEPTERKEGGGLQPRGGGRPNPPTLDPPHRTTPEPTSPPSRRASRPRLPAGSPRVPCSQTSRVPRHRRSRGFWNPLFSCSTLTPAVGPVHRTTPM